MNATELASFRTLLQAQAPPRPDGALFARMRARLTVVERVEPPPGHLPPRPVGPPPRLERVTSAPSVTAGGSPARPACTQRSLLMRLDALLQAERHGLDARIAADAPAA